MIQNSFKTKKQFSNYTKLINLEAKLNKYLTCWEQTEIHIFPGLRVLPSQNIDTLGVENEGRVCVENLWLETPVSVAAEVPGCPAALRLTDIHGKIRRVIGAVEHKSETLRNLVWRLQAK